MISTAWKLFLATSLAVVLIAATAAVIDGNQTDASPGGGGADLPNDTFTIKVDIVGANCASGWSSEEYDCSLKVNSDTVNDGEELLFEAGTEITVEIVPGYTYAGFGNFEYVYAMYIEIRYESGFHDGRCYGVGGAYKSDGVYNNTQPTTSFKFVVDGDMTLYVEFGSLDANYQHIQLKGEYGGVTTLAGHTYHTGDTFIIDSLPSNRTPKCWTVLDVDAEGLVPLVTFGDYPEGDYLFEGYVYGDKIEWTTVGQLVITIEFVKPTISLDVSKALDLGSTASMKIDVNPFDPKWTDFGIEWSSEDPGIVSVDSYGNITGESAGSTKVIATVYYGELCFTAECEVTVNAPQEYTITLNKDGNGTMTSSHLKATAGTEVMISVNPDLGYRLAEITAMDNVYLEESEGRYTFTMPDTDVVITATFVPITHMVTFHNGETVFDTKLVDHGNTITYPDTNPTRESDDVYHYRFSGWTYGDGTPVSEDAIVTGDMDLYASFDPVPRMYDIYFMDGTTIYEHLELPYGAVIEAPDTDPYREGYEFVRWDGYEEGTRVSDDMTFEAVFEEVTEPLPPWVIPGDDDLWIPPTVIYDNRGDDDDLWIFVVLGSVALCLFLLFVRYDRRG